MHIGILQTGHAPQEIMQTQGDYDAMFHRLLDGGDFKFTTWNVVDMDFPGSTDAADGWLITGSKHGAYEDHPWIPPLEELIRAIRDAEQPLVGVCFGHQIIAQALGGKVEKFDKGWSVGRTAYSVGGQTQHLNAWHQDQVVERPDGATVEASSGFCENAVLAYGDKIWTIQPHPEFGPEVVKGLIDHRGPGVMPDPLLDGASAGLDRPTDNAAIAAKMIAVLRGEAA